MASSSLAVILICSARLGKSPKQNWIISSRTFSTSSFTLPTNLLESSSASEIRFWISSLNISTFRKLEGLIPWSSAMSSLICFQKTGSKNLSLSYPNSSVWVLKILLTRLRSCQFWSDWPFSIPTRQFRTISLAVNENLWYIWRKYWFFSASVL